MSASVNVSNWDAAPGSTEEAEGLLSAAESSLAQGQAAAAFFSLRTLWKYPGNILRSDDVWPRALRVLADVCTATDPENALTGAAERAASDNGTPQSLYDLARGLAGQYQFDTATTALLIAHEMVPDDPNVFIELVATLSRGEQYAEAIRHLQANPAMLDSSPACRTHLVWNAIMAGNLGLARESHARFTSSEAGESRGKSPLDMVLDRADAVQGICPLDTRDLRGWHYVLNGGLLLHVSPYGFDNGMNGRYCWTHDSAGKCHEGIQRIKAALEAQGVTSPRVFVLPELKSAILAHALATALGSEAVPWPDGGSAESGVIVAYDLEILPQETLRSLFAYHAGQLLWAHALCWTDLEPWLPKPDFVTFLYQTVVSPWEQGISAPGGTAADRKDDEQLLPKNREVLSRRILEADLDNQLGEPLADMSTVRAIAKLMANDAPKGPLEGSYFRVKQIPGSPVPTSRF